MKIIYVKICFCQKMQISLQNNSISFNQQCFSEKFANKFYVNIIVQDVTFNALLSTIDFQSKISIVRYSSFKRTISKELK